MTQITATFKPGDLNIEFKVTAETVKEVAVAINEITTLCKEAKR